MTKHLIFFCHQIIILPFNSYNSSLPLRSLFLSRSIKTHFFSPARSKPLFLSRSIKTHFFSPARSKPLFLSRSIKSPIFLPLDQNSFLESPRITGESPLSSPRWSQSVNLHSHPHLKDFSPPVHHLNHDLLSHLHLRYESLILRKP